MFLTEAICKKYAEILVNVIMHFFCIILSTILVVMNLNFDNKQQSSFATAEYNFVHLIVLYNLNIFRLLLL